jgi:hypothetical protein
MQSGKKQVVQVLQQIQPQGQLVQQEQQLLERQQEKAPPSQAILK